MPLKIPELFPPSDLLSRVQGVEKGLKQRRLLGTVGWVGAVIGSAAQITILVRNSEWLDALRHAKWRQIFDDWPFLVALFIPVLLLVLYLWTKFWLAESERPFRYSFSVDDFDSITESPDPTLAWLRHDLAKRLNKRIGRLSILEKQGSEGGESGDGVADQSADARPTDDESHIHVSGYLGVRKETSGWWVLDAMPRVRVGPATRPETLAHTIHFRLNEVEENGQDVEAERLDEEDYEKLLERVYFSVASQIYKQIRADVERKIRLLPTRYFKATAYLYEADDYAHSNTLDGYDDARILYDRALQMFDPTWRPLPAVRVRRFFRKLQRLGARFRGWLRRGLAHFWTRAAKVELRAARTRIGFARTLIFRRELAGSSGQRLNPVYEARPVALNAVSALEKLPADVPGRQASLFDAYVTLAHTWYQLGATGRAESSLAAARGIQPSRAQIDPPLLYVAGLVDPQPRSELLLSRQAVEIDPAFEAAQSTVAFQMEKEWRSAPELGPASAKMVLDEYDRLTALNPGNIAGWANRGYLNWLLENRVDAAEDFRRGLEYKEIKRGTFVAELDYGLGRIYAEYGDWIKAYHHFTGALTGHLINGTFTWVELGRYYFDAVNEKALQRYATYHMRVKGKYDEREREEELDAQHHSADGAEATEGPQASKRMRQTVLAFVLNDCGEAWHAYYRRTRQPEHLEQALQQFRAASGLDPDFVIPHYNLYWAAGDPESTEHRDRIYELEPEWLGAKMIRMDVRAAEGHVKGEMARRHERDIQRLRDRLREHEDRPTGPEEDFAWGLTSAEPYVKLSERERRATDARSLKKQIDEHLEWAKTLASEADAARQDAESILRELVPHEWLWKLRKGTFRFNVHVVSDRRYRKQFKWERELDDLHVQSLYYWALAESRPGRRVTGGAKILGHIERYLWPDHEVILQELRDEVELRNRLRIERRERLAAGALRPFLEYWNQWRPATEMLAGLRRQAKVQKRVQQHNETLSFTVLRPLDADPASFEALERLAQSHLLMVWDGERRLRLEGRTVAALEEQARLLRALNERPGVSPPVLKWIGDELWKLARQANFLEELADALEPGNEELPAEERWKRVCDRLAWTMEIADEDRWTISVDPWVVSGLREAVNTRDSSLLRGIGFALRDQAARLREPESSMVEAYDGAAECDDPALLWDIGQRMFELERWDKGLAVFQSARSADRERARRTVGRAHSENDYHQAVGRAHWILGKHTVSLNELSRTIGPTDGHGAAGWRSELIDELIRLGRQGSENEVRLLRAWLEWQQADLLHVFEPDRADAGRALLALTRRASWAVRDSGPWSPPMRHVPEAAAPGSAPVLTPIVLEADPSLFPKGHLTPGVDRMINELIPEMRDRIIYRLGVAVPYVQVRPGASDPAKPPHWFSVILHEVPRALARVPEDEPPFDYMVFEGLYPVLLRYADTFLGSQEVTQMIDRWKVDAELEESDLLDLTRHSPTARVAFVAVLQRLVREGVNVGDLTPILQAFRSAYAEEAQQPGDVDLDGLAEKVRGDALRERIDTDGRRLLAVSPEQEQVIRGWVHRADGREFVAVPRTDQPILADVRAGIAASLGGADPSSVALVVRDEHLRRFVRRLVEGTHPQLAVYARGELAPEREGELEAIMASHLRVAGGPA